MFGVVYSTFIKLVDHFIIIINFVIYFFTIFLYHCSTVVQQLVYVGMVSKSIPLQSKTITLIGELQYIM